MENFIFGSVVGAVVVMFWNAVTGPEYVDQGDEIPPEREKIYKASIDAGMEIARAAEKFCRSQKEEDFIALAKLLEIEF